MFSPNQRVCINAGSAHTTWGTVVSQSGDRVTVRWDSGRTTTVLAAELTSR